MNNIIFKTTFLKGEDGNNILRIDKTATSGLVDTYTITLTDGTTTTFNVTNGSSIATIEKTATVGMVDTYTITLTDGSTSTFEVTNGANVTIDDQLDDDSTNPVQNKVVTGAISGLSTAVGNISNNLSWYVANGWLPAIPSGDVPANMEDCSWAMLKSLASAGTLGNYYQIGDTKTIELNGGERVVMELVSINDGEGTAGGYYPRGTVDFISKDCLQTTRSMNSSATNAGGWTSSNLRSVLNTTIYETLPQAVKDVLVEKTHKTSAGSQSTSLVEHTDKLWLPTEYEMFGAITYSVSTENANFNKHYAVFDTNADRIKHQGTNGSAVLWWESSPSVSYSTNFCDITTSGGAHTSNTNSSYGVPLCFRIGQLFT